MAQIINGFRKVLNNPSFYNIFQAALGAKRARQFYVTNYIRPSYGNKILDIGCGTAEILKFLPPHVEYYGFDLNEDYIKYAKREFENRGHFECANVNDIIIDSFPQFNIILATAILHHLDDNEVISLLTKVKNKLNENGRLVTFDCCYTDNQSKIARYIINKDRGQNIRTAKNYEALALQVFKDVKTHIRHDLLRVPYTHIIMECHL